MYVTPLTAGVPEAVVHKLPPRICGHSDYLPENVHKPVITATGQLWVAVINLKLNFE